MFWPFIFGDIFTFAFWPYDYYDPFWFYGSDFLLISIFAPGPYFGGDYAHIGRVTSLIYVLGAVVIWLAPETRGRPLPE